jgi:hypothetical protein
MSSAEHFAHFHKIRTDQAISRAYGRLATDVMARGVFAELLCHARRLAPSVLAAPCSDAYHPAIEALVNLSRSSDAHVRQITTWLGSQGSWRVAIDSLIQHLVAKYPIPRFLTSAWHLQGNAENERQRQWSIQHGRGASFRSMDVPIKMTRRMEDIFLRSPDHMGIDMAMRRAELIGLGVSEGLAATILLTRLATDLQHGDFWRTVWHFLRANAADIDLAQVAPMIDFIYSIRQERVVVLTHDGTVYREPPHADFSMKGRTIASMLRLMADWHRGLRSGSGRLIWSPSTLCPLEVEVPATDPSELPRRWQFVELTSSMQLEMEGRALQHCVVSYASRCWRGACLIWSLRIIRNDKPRAVATLEIDPKRRAIVQARGTHNRYPSGKPLQLIKLWANREGLRLLI